MLTDSSTLTLATITVTTVIIHFKELISNDPTVTLIATKVFTSFIAPFELTTRFSSPMFT